MSSLESWLNKHQAIMTILGGIIATLVTLTAYAYTTFQTKADTDKQIVVINEQFKYMLEAIDKRLERIENKLDDIKN